MTQDIQELRYKLLGSLLEFTRVFYYLRTGREYEMSFPEGRESHFITICRFLSSIYRGQFTDDIYAINVPPRYGKTELMIHFVAWTLARYPMNSYIYTSYSHTLAKRQTQTIRQIITSPYYRKMFGVQLSPDSTAKDNFETSKGGKIYAAGSGGTITGTGAGLKSVSHFGGCIIGDDLHKPNEAGSDVIRESVIDWFYNTLSSRRNSPKTPLILIGQRVHEADIIGHLAERQQCNLLKLAALDENNNALYPKMHDREALLRMKEQMPYVFAAQYQQEPQPAGGGIFKPEWFMLMDEDPKILATFITVDTAETEKSYNDATVFSFWGLYKVKHEEVETDEMALHWLDCWEIRVEPKDLREEFMAFYADCMRYKVKPTHVIIEKKSTGTTLLSVINGMQGLRALDVNRNNDGSLGFKNKTDRFLACQQYVASKLISLPRYGKHTHRCIDHCKKITANESHRFDDIADTLADAIRAGLMDKIIYRSSLEQEIDPIKAQKLMAMTNRLSVLKTGRM